MNNEEYFLIEQLWRELKRSRETPIPTSHQVHELKEQLDRAGLKLGRK